MAIESLTVGDQANAFFGKRNAENSDYVQIDANPDGMHSPMKLQTAGEVALRRSAREALASPRQRNGGQTCGE